MRRRRATTDPSFGAPVASASLATSSPIPKETGENGKESGASRPWGLLARIDPSASPSVWIRHDQDEPSAPSSALGNRWRGLSRSTRALTRPSKRPLRKQPRPLRRRWTYPHPAPQARQQRCWRPHHPSPTRSAVAHRHTKRALPRAPTRAPRGPESPRRHHHRRPSTRKGAFPRISCRTDAAISLHQVRVFRMVSAATPIARASCAAAGRSSFMASSASRQRDAMKTGRAVETKGRRAHPCWMRKPEPCSPKLG